MRKLTLFMLTCLFTGFSIEAQQSFSMTVKTIDGRVHVLCDTGSVSDIDGNSYKTVKIGNNTWMAENLKTTKFNDGSQIPNVTGNHEWGSLSCGAYCWYNNDENNKEEYGALYNQYVVMDSRNICPTGWHLPTPAEWNSFPCRYQYDIDESGHYSNCPELLAAGYWRCPATNETGLSLVPSGVRQGLFFQQQPLGQFKALGSHALYWQSDGDYTEFSEDYGIAHQEWYFFPSILDGYSIRCIEVKEMIIKVPDMSVIRNTTFEIPVYASNLPANEVISYQFEMNYDGRKIQYQNFTVESTLSYNDNIQVNSTEDQLSVAFASQIPLADSGILIKFLFKALEPGIITPVLSEFLINTDTIRNITNGTITIVPDYGDVDANGNIQAYDAALTLQYSAGLEPLPVIDPLPWETWRITDADVDGAFGITAYDASLILQYVVDLIHSFPVQNNMDSADFPMADVTVLTEGGYVVFRSYGDLYGLNVSVGGKTAILGSPQIGDSNLLISSKTDSSSYSIAIATAYAPIENAIILKIPFSSSSSDQSLIFRMKINNQDKQVNLGIPVGLSKSVSKSVVMFPNPANTILYFKNLEDATSVSIYDILGRKITSGIITNNQFDISNLPHGLYTFRIEEGKNIYTGRLIKQ
jgi:uncharacterized protein (TIGR02145 family)